MLGDGAPDTVLDHYNALSARENKLDEDSLISAYNGRGGIVSGEPTFKIQRAALLDSEGNDRVSFLSGERAKLLCTFCHEGSEEISELTMGLHIRDARGYEIFGTNTFHTQFKMGTVSPHSPMTLAFDFPLNIGRGRYTIGLAFHSGREHTAKNYKWMDKAIVFEVADDHRYVFDGVARLDGHFTRVE
jgi:lipopolysaccharide transport system ATP-binding protein